MIHELRLLCDLNGMLYFVAAISRYWRNIACWTVVFLELFKFRIAYQLKTQQWFRTAHSLVYGMTHH